MGAKFKTGDRVKVLRNKYNDPCVITGNEYTIKSWANVFGDYWYWLYDDDSLFHHDEDDLELVRRVQPTLSEVVDLIKEMRIIMTIQGRNGEDITRMAHNICKQYGYDLPEEITKE